MSSLTKSVEVDASKADAWAVLADYGTVSNWAPTIVSSGIVGGQADGVGAVRTCDHEKMGTLEETVVSWTDGSEYAYDVTSGLPFPMRALRNTWSVEGDGASARVTLHQEFSTKLGPMGLLMEATMLKRMMRKEMTLALAGLKYHIETGAVATSSSNLPLNAVS